MIGCGGSLKIPKLQEGICSLFPSAEALTNIAPDELIALGAAKQAGFCIKYENLPESLAVDTPVLSNSLLLRVSCPNLFILFYLFIFAFKLFIFLPRWDKIILMKRNRI